MTVADFSAPDDDAARTLSEDAAQEHRAELWRGDQLVARFEPD